MTNIKAGNDDTNSSSIKIKYGLERKTFFCDGQVIADTSSLGVDFLIF